MCNIYQAVYITNIKISIYESMQVALKSASLHAGYA